MSDKWPREPVTFLLKVLYTLLSTSRKQEINFNIYKMTDWLKKEQFRRTLVCDFLVDKHFSRSSVW